MDQTPDSPVELERIGKVEEKYPWLRRLEFTMALIAVLAVGAILVWKVL